MELSISIARVMGPLLVIVSLGLLLNMKRYQSLISDFFKNEALIFLSSFIALAVGLILVMKHNYWVASWEVLVTVLSWIILLKGALAILFPEQTMEFAKSMKSKSMLTFWAFVDLIIGGALIYISYSIG